MGQKVHPYGLRLGIIRQSHSTWFAEGGLYKDNLLGDLKMRRHIVKTQANAGISSIRFERSADTVIVTIVTAKPGIVIGPRGRDVEVLRQKLEKIAGIKVRVNVEEAKSPDMDAALVAQNIARQIERRISFRRAVRQAMERCMRSGAKGVRCMVSGRLGGAEIARTELMGPEGRVPLHTLRADIDYGMAEAATGYGNIGVKVWIYKGDILPPKKIKVVPVEEAVVEEPVEVAPAADQIEDALAEAPAPVAPVAPVGPSAYVQEVETIPLADTSDVVVEAIEEGASE